jgi:hypothetical protein
MLMTMDAIGVHDGGAAAAVGYDSDSMPYFRALGLMDFMLITMHFRGMTGPLLMQLAMILTACHTLWQLDGLMGRFHADYHATKWGAQQGCC